MIPEVFVNEIGVMLEEIEDNFLARGKKIEEISHENLALFLGNYISNLIDNLDKDGPVHGNKGLILRRLTQISAMAYYLYEQISEEDEEDHVEPFLD